MKELETCTPSAVWALDERDPAAGNASHEYGLTYAPGEELKIRFQHGPRQHGLNGFFDDDLLAIVQDRYEGFQSGQFACDENEEALKYIGLAREAIARRVADRERRGVLGRNEK